MSGIQPSIIKDIALLQKEIRDLHNLCIVVCEQVLIFVLDIADRILVMENSRVVHSGTRDRVDEAPLRLSGLLSSGPMSLGFPWAPRGNLSTFQGA